MTDSQSCHLQVTAPLSFITKRT